MSYFSFFFFNDPATTEIYTLSLHDALPISQGRAPAQEGLDRCLGGGRRIAPTARAASARTPRSAPPVVTTSERSEEHTSELQSRLHLVCRLLLEKKKQKPLKTIRSIHLIKK